MCIYSSGKSVYCNESDLNNINSDLDYISKSQCEELFRPELKNTSLTSRPMSIEDRVECFGVNINNVCEDGESSTIVKGTKTVSNCKAMFSILKRPWNNSTYLLKVKLSHNTYADWKWKWACNTSVTINMNNDVINSFNSISDKEKQYMHLSGLISITTIQTHGPKTRSQNRDYAAYYWI